MVALTIGMATYNDYDGVYFTLQALRLYQDLTDTELLVIDNYGCADTKNLVENWIKARYILAKDVTGTAAPRDLVFRQASGEAVLCCDAHVLLAPGSVARLRAYYRDHPDTRDLLQGPLVYDDLENVATHFDPVWRGQMWGIWATDPRGRDPEGEPFEIPMQGLGVFSCRKAAWPGFHPGFRGFGGEEGYIHEKIRQAGGHCLCLPWLRWVHRFHRASGPPYPLYIEDKLRNYVLGHTELGLDLAPVLAHFSEHLPPEKVQAVAEATLREGVCPPPQLVQATEAPVTALAPSPQPRSDFPLVSCLCPTYNRPPNHQHLLEEAIESFLRQTYPNKELIILNDCPGQELVCNAPGVRVVNVPERFPTLGEKHNAMVALAQGDLLALWDDDDISLPWRLSFSVERLGDADYFNPRAYWFWDGAGLHFDHATGYAHNASLFRRAAYTAVGGYPPVNLGADAALDGKFQAKVAQAVDPLRGAPALARNEWFYIYRWGASPLHLSSGGDESRYREIGKRPVRAGRFQLRPHWRQDYVAKTRELLSV